MIRINFVKNLIILLDPLQDKIIIKNFLQECITIFLYQRYEQY